MFTPQKPSVGWGLVPRRKCAIPHPTGLLRYIAAYATGMFALAFALAFALPGGAQSAMPTAGSASFTRRFQAVPPADVKAGHWAAPFVQDVLANGVMTLPDGREFHGEAKVTYQEASVLLARLAQALLSGHWRAQPSRAVPTGVLKPLEHGDWATQRVTRYEMAKILANMGDYVANGLPRPDPNAKTLGKSQALPPRPPLKIPRSNPAYAALAYLVEARMATPKSPLLRADDTPIRGGELSQALAEMVTGLVDRQTDLGLDEEGSTPDKSFHGKPADKRADGASKADGK